MNRTVHLPGEATHRPPRFLKNTCDNYVAMTQSEWTGEPAQPRFSRRILLLTQTFPPDPAAVGQHMRDLAGRLASRGNDVTVVTADRGYDDPSVTFLRDELTPEGVHVQRLRYTSFGKSSLLHRIAAMLSFGIQSGLLTLLHPQLDAVVFTTSPPFIGLWAVAVGALRRVPTVFWAMDLNPAQLVALGKLPPRGTAARVLQWINRVILRSTSVTIALDELMAQRLQQEARRPIAVVVIPPWSPDESLIPTPHESNPFRMKYALDDKTVVMYSGNHTPSNPLTTLLDAIVALHDCPRLQFVFVGEGTGKREVERYVEKYALKNVLVLPYQPKATLSDSLSAADVHVVSLGDEMAGIIHPCKVYGAMAVGRPILCFGPSPSHMTRILATWNNGWAIRHGDVNEAVATLRHIATLSQPELATIGMRGLVAIDGHFDPIALSSSVAAVVENAVSRQRRE